MINNKQVPALTALRFFAAAAIVIGHSSGHFSFAAPIRSFPWGFGVSFFFVLSGFILKFVYKDLTSGAEIRSFLVARFARVWPLHAVVLALYLLLIPSAIWVIANTRGNWLELLLAQLFLVHSLIPKLEAFSAYNAVSWSISSEMFFYLAFPLLLHRWASSWWWKSLLVAAIAAAVLTATTMLPIPYAPADRPDIVSAFPFGYTFPTTRIVEFVLGMSMASLFERIRPTGAAWKWTLLELGTIAAVPLSYFVFTNAPSSLLGADMSHTSWGMFARTAACAPAFALLILVFAFQKGGFSRAISGKAWVHLGEVSYALYLFHYMVLLRLSSLRALLHQLPELVICALYVSILIGGSFALWYLVERPCRFAIRRAYDNRVKGG